MFTKQNSALNLLAGISCLHRVMVLKIMKIITMLKFKYKYPEASYHTHQKQGISKARGGGEISKPPLPSTPVR